MGKEMVDIGGRMSREEITGYLRTETGEEYHTRHRREEIDKVLRHYLESTCSAVIGICTIKKVCEEGEICPIINKLLPDFKKDLHSQGVVIRVDRELPEIKNNKYIPNWGRWGNWFNQLWRGGQFIYQQKIKKAGYVAVEPLMEG